MRYYFEDAPFPVAMRNAVKANVGALIVLCPARLGDTREEVIANLEHLSAHEMVVGFVPTHRREAGIPETGELIE